MIVQRLKFAVAAKVKRNPTTWSFFWERMPHWPILLPHDQSYLGFRHLINEEAGLFLDVGANNGITAAGFRKLDDRYRILSIEADPNHEPALNRLSRKLADFEYKIIAAGDVRDELTLYTPIYQGKPIHTHTSSDLEYLKIAMERDFPRQFPSVDYRKQSVPVIPLDDLELRPNIVKIDVEGHDAAVLRGLGQTVAACRPYFLLEYTPEFSEQCEQWLRDRDYEFFVYDATENQFTPFVVERESELWRSESLQVNLFCIPQERCESLPLRAP